MIGHPRAEWWRPDFEGDSRHRSAAVDAAKPKGSEGAVPYWALMAFMFIGLIAPQTLFPTVVPFRLGLLTSGLAIAAHLFNIFRWQPLRLSPEIRILACLVAWAIVTAPLSYRPRDSVSFLFGDY